MRRAALLALAAAVVVGIVSSPRSAEPADAAIPTEGLYTITDLGPSGGYAAFAVNDTGDVVGMKANGNGFRYSEGALVDIGPGAALSVTDAGAAYGPGHGTGIGGKALTVTPDGKTAGGTALEPSVTGPSFPNGTSMAGTWSSANGWRSTYTRGCSLPGLVSAGAWAINAAGVLVGQAVRDPDRDVSNGIAGGLAFKCTPNSAAPDTYIAVDLAPFSGPNTGAFAVNSDGVVAGKAQIGGGPIEAHVWNAFTSVPLGTVAEGHQPTTTLPSQSAGYGINDSGTVVGTYGPTATSPTLQVGSIHNRGFIWSPSDQRMRDLTDMLPADSRTTWTLTAAFDVNNRGQIVGQGRINGEFHAFLLTPRGDVNITADRIVVTQGIQNERNLNLLVAYKQAYAIVRAHTDTRAVPRVTAVLRAFRSGTQIGEIRPVNPPAHIHVRPNPAASEQSFVFALPPGWTAAGDLRLEALVNGTFAIPETNYEDNEPPATTVTFREPPEPLTVVVLDTYFAGQARPPSNVVSYTTVWKYVRRLFPTSQIDIRHAPVPVAIAPPAADSDDRCGDVVRELAKKRASMNVDARTMIYGLLNLQADGSSPYGGGTAGCSFVPAMVATGWTSRFTREVAAHELIHASGRNHVERCGAVGADIPGYPAPALAGRVYAGSLHQGAFPLPEGFDLGFDGDTLQFLPLNSPSDIMTYCFNSIWISDYTYENLYRAISEIGARPEAEWCGICGGFDAAHIVGTIDNLDGDTMLSATHAPLESTPPASTPGPYRIEFYDGPTKLSDVPFTPARMGAHAVGGDDAPLALIDEWVPLPGAADRIVIYDDVARREIGSISISGVAPSVQAVSPSNGAALPASGSVTIDWLADDDDGDALTHTVLYRPDVESPWTILAAQLNVTSLTVDASVLAGSGAGQLRIVTNDGFYTARDDITGLSVPQKAPIVSIGAPVDGATVTTEQSVLLEGSAGVLGPSLPDSAFVWRSDLDGLLGTGPTALVQSLSVGRHELELRVDGPGSTIGRATAVITVGEDGTTPPELAVSSDAMTFNVVPGSPAITQSLEVYDLAGSSVAWTAESSDPARVTLSAAAGTTPATIDVSVDTSGVHGGEKNAAQLTIRRTDGSQAPIVVEINAESGVGATTLSPTAIVFGRQQQGATGSPRTVTLTNNSGDPMTLGAATLAGAAPTEFVLPDDGCAGAELSTGESCSVDVAFGPTRAGRRSAYLVLADSDSTAGWYVPLTGLAHRQVAQPTGKLLGWGKNNFGQVGLANTTPPCTAGIRCIPLLRDIGIADAIAVGSNFFASAAVKSDGTAWTWGTNCSGVLGNLALQDCVTTVLTPQKVQYGTFSNEGDLTGVTDVAAGGDHFVALRDDGSVVAWGSNSHGQVRGCGGGGSSGAWVSRAVPVRTSPCDTDFLGGIVAIAAGQQPDIFTSGSSYGLKADGTVVQWGATHGGSNTFGAFEPVQILGPGGAPLTGIIEIAAQMALRQDGTVWTWGEGLDGQLGNGQLSDPNGVPGDITAVQVLRPDGSGPLADVKAIAAFDRERYALTNDGRVLAWGSGGFDAGIALGIGGVRPAVTPLPTPVLAPGGAAPLTGVVDIGAGLARRADGSVVAWGDAQYGILGDGTYFLNPWGNIVAVPPTPDVGQRWSVPVRGEGGSGFLTGTARLLGGLTRFALTGGPGGGSGGGPSTLTGGAPVAVAPTAGSPFGEVIASFGDSLPTEAFAFSVNVDWGDDSADSSAVVTGPDGGPYQIHGAHTYESAGDYELTIDVASRAGDSITLTGTANVDVVTLGALPARESPFVAGTTASHPLAGFTTPNRASDEASFHAMVDWGDGAPPEAALVLGPPGGPFDVVAEHAYRRADTDPYPLVLHVTDEDGAEITLPGAAIVTPASLVADATFGTDVLAGRTFSGSIARFRDGNPLSRAADYSALIRWGDGTETVGVLTGPNGGPYIVAGSHEYLGDGPFGVDVILTGPGTSATASTTLLQRQHRLVLTGSAAPTGGAVPLDVTFTYVARNDGETALWLVDVFGTSCGPATRSRPDPNGNGVLDPGEVWTFTCDHTFAQAGDISEVAAATAFGLNDALGVRSNGVTTPISVGSGWPFSGFFQPVDNPPAVNVVKAGSTVPVKFGLGADRGLDIFAVGFPASVKTACDSGSPQDDLEQVASPGAAPLTYDAAASRYQFNWKTAGSWATTCRKLTLRFRLGGEETALFRFK